MLCPVCKAECGEKNSCCDCGFTEVNATFINTDEAAEWESKVLNPYKENYFSSLIADKTIKVNGNTLLYCYKNQKSKERVVIPDYITHISSNAFCGGKMKELYLPNNITELPHDVFACCTSLKRIHLPEKIESIPSGSFSHCWSLEELYIPRNVKSIAYDAFDNCHSLKSIEIDPRNRYLIKKGDCIIDIHGNLVFSGGSAMLPNTYIKSINGSVLQYSNCTSLIIPEGVVEIGREMPNTSYGSPPIFRCDELKTIVFPDSLTYIGRAIQECQSLEKISLPRNVHTIMPGAFYGCNALSSIEIDKRNEMFYSIDNCIIEKAKRTVYLGIASSVIPNDGSVVAIDYRAFEDLKSHTSLVIPRAITKVEHFAFCGTYFDIFCEAEAKPAGWSNLWSRAHMGNIYRGNEWHYEERTPVLNKGITNAKKEPLPF